MTRCCSVRFFFFFSFSPSCSSFSFSPYSLFLRRLHSSSSSSLSSSSSSSFSLRSYSSQLYIGSKPVEELSIITHADRARELGKETCLRLKDVIKRQLFKIAIQAAIGGKIIAREDVREYRKDVTAKCYGGDQSRKLKLLKQQAEGKRKMRLIGKVEIPHDAFVHVLRKA